MPTILPRPAAERGHLDFGWLKTWHTFSFGEYHDEAWMGFRSLRVINEDIVAAGAGFPPHPHRDMEIVTIPLVGAIAHQDSTGGKGVIRRGEVQRMSAGTGVTHSEFNASKTEALHLYQIWLLPRQRGITPGYEQKAFADADLAGRLRLVAAPDGRDGSVTIQTDAELRHGRLMPGQGLRQPIAAGRHAWVQVVAGAVTLRSGIESLAMSASDGAGVSAADALEFTAGAAGAELLMFDLA